MKTKFTEGLDWTEATAPVGTHILTQDLAALFGLSTCNFLLASEGPAGSHGHLKVPACSSAAACIPGRQDRGVRGRGLCRVANSSRNNAL